MTAETALPLLTVSEAAKQSKRGIRENGKRHRQCTLSTRVTKNGSMESGCSPGGEHDSNYRTYVRYAQQLEEFILKYKASPPDIKFWPYGPYWPPDIQGPVEETPRHNRQLPAHDELLWYHGGSDTSQNHICDICEIKYHITT